MIESGGAPLPPAGGRFEARREHADSRRWEQQASGDPADLRAVPHARQPADGGGSAPAEGVRRVRPYVQTGGRTRSRTELALETLVTVSGRPGRPASLESRKVVELCWVPRSIAEVAALSALPVGVARVLVGDLAEQGLLIVHDTRGTAPAADDVELMQRVLAGLRRL